MRINNNKIKLYYSLCLLLFITISVVLFSGIRQQAAQSVTNQLQVLRVPSANQKDTVTNNCKQRPLIFLKGHKVAGTAISSMLSAYVVVSEREHVTFSQMMTRNKSWCGIVAGTDHPDVGTGIMVLEESKRRGENPIIFISVRQPIQRSWSSFIHALEKANYAGNSISFLHDVDYPPPHYLLSKDNKLAKSLIDFKDVIVFDSSRLDESLLLLSKSAGIDKCYFMYSTCEDLSFKQAWDYLKCRPEPRMQLDTYTARLIESRARITGESDFYITAMYLFNKHETQIQDELKDFQMLREHAASQCQRPEVMQQALKKLQANRKVVRNSEGEYRLIAERVHQIDLNAVCMQLWACYHESKRFYGMTTKMVSDQD